MSTVAHAQEKSRADISVSVTFTRQKCAGKQCGGTYGIAECRIHSTGTQCKVFTYANVWKPCSRTYGVQCTHICSQKNKERCMCPWRMQTKEYGHSMTRTRTIHNTLCPSALKGHSLAVVSTFTFLGQWLGSFLPPPLPLPSRQKQERSDVEKAITELYN